MIPADCTMSADLLRRDPLGDAGIPGRVTCDDCRPMFGLVAAHRGSQILRGVHHDQDG